MYGPYRLFFFGGGEYLKSFQCIFRVNQMKCILVAPTNGPFKGGMVCSFHETRLETFKMQCYLSNGSFLEILLIFYISFFCFGIYAVVLFGLCCFSCFLKSFVCSRAEEAAGPRQQNSVVRAKLARGQTFSKQNKQGIFKIEEN